MKKLSITIQCKPHSTYITMSGSLVLSQALYLKSKFHDICASNKDLYIDIKDLSDIDLNGLSALLVARQLTNQSGGELFVFTHAQSPLFNLLSNIKFTNQLQFRDCIISNPTLLLAS